jgi:hypothetical protein
MEELANFPDRDLLETRSNHVRDPP